MKTFIDLKMLAIIKQANLMHKALNKNILTINTFIVCLQKKNLFLISYAIIKQLVN